jgi:C-methyltransferase
MAGSMAAAGKLSAVMSGHWYARALWIITHLKIADRIDADRPAELETLAQAAGVDAKRLGRVMGAVISKGIFERSGENSFRHNDASLLLRTDHPQSQWALVEVNGGGAHYAAFDNMLDAVVAPRSAFAARHGVELFEFNNQNPEDSRLYAASMTTLTRRVVDAVVSYSFKPFRRVVDVGGSNGLLLKSVVAAHQDASGIVFDLPVVVADTEKDFQVSKDTARLSVVPGSFFTDPIPSADLYLLKNILHDWSDADCIAILRNIRKSIEPDGRVAIIEVALPDYASDHPAWRPS